MANLAAQEIHKSPPQNQRHELYMPKGVDAFLDILNAHESSRKVPLTNAKGASLTNGIEIDVPFGWVLKITLMALK